ncbi:MAG: MFS transporter [Coriobacteriales bacterium]
MKDTDNKSPSPPQDNPFAEASDARKKITLLAIFLGVFGSILQSGTLSTMLPMAAAEIGGADYYSLASTLGAPISIAAMPLWGYIAARSPHLKMPLFMTSMGFGALAILVRLLAPNMAVIIAAMFFWGLVSPGIFVVGYALIRDMYDPKKAGVYLGLCSTLMMAAMLVGPIGGGFLMTAFGWRLLNAVILPFIAAALVLAFFGVKVTKEQVAHLAHAGGSFDFLGTVALTIGLGGLILYLSAGTSILPFFSMGSNVLLVVTAIALALLVWVVVKKQGDAIIPAPAFKNRNVLAFAAANFCANFSNMAAFFFLPSFIIYVMGGTGSDSGLVMACFSVAGIFLGPVVGKAIAKSGTAKPMMLLNGALRAALMVVLIFLLGPETPVWVLMAFMLCAGVYNGVNGPCFSAGPQIQLPSELRVQGNSLIQCGQNFGSGVGTAVYTAIIGMFGITGGMPIALAIAAAFGALVCVCALFLQKAQAAQQ